MKKQIAIVIILLLGIVVSVFLSQRQQIFKSRAALQAYSAFNVGSGEPGKYVNCSGNVCETNTLNITISVRDLQALNIQDQQVASQQQCSWQSAPVRCTGCGVGSILEQESCSGEIRVTADDVASDECNLPEWCGSYVTQNITERPPEQIPEPQGEPQQTCEEKSYCDDNLGLRVFRNTCRGTPVKEAEFDPECVPAEQVALNEKLSQEAEIQALAQLQPEVQPQQNFPPNIVSVIRDYGILGWKVASSIFTDAEQKSEQQTQQEQNLPDECKNSREDYLSDECKALLANIPKDERSSGEKATEAETTALETGSAKESLKKLNVDLDIKEEKLNIGLCLNPLVCLTTDFFVPQDAKNTVAAVILKRQTEELAEKLNLDLSINPNEWDPAKREYFFKMVANGDINVAKALAEFIVPISTMEKTQLALEGCKKRRGNNCLSSTDNILGVVSLTDQDIDQANQWLKEKDPNFSPADSNLVREFGKLVYEDPTSSPYFIDQYLPEKALQKLKQQMATKLGISEEQLELIKNNFEAYGQYGDYIRNNTSEGKLLQANQNELGEQMAIAAVTSIPTADLVTEGAVFATRKLGSKAIGALTKKFGREVAGQIEKDVTKVAEKGGKNMTAVEAASVRKAEEALAGESGGEVLLAATPAESLTNLVKNGGFDSEAQAALKAARDNPNLDQTAAKGLTDARNGSRELDAAGVVVSPPDANFVPPDVPSKNPFQALVDGVDGLVNPPEPPVTGVRKLADVADNLEGAEARLFGETPPPPKPAADMWNQATDGLRSWVDDLAGAPCPVGIGLIPVAYAQSGGSPCIKAGLDEVISLEKNLAAGQKTPELEEFWQSLVRDADGRFKKYQDEQNAFYYYKGPQPSFSLADQDAVRYVQHSLDTRRAFLEGMEQGWVDSSQKDFQQWLVDLHQKQAYKPAQKPGELSEGGLLSHGAHTPFIKGDVVVIAEKYQDPYANFYKNPKSYGNTYNLDLPGISPKGRPQDGLVGDLIFHQYPNSIFRDEYTSVMQQKLQELGKLGREAPLDQQIRLISEFYQYAINDRMFTEVNQSLYMNMVNGLLEQRGLKPIEHGVLDFVAMRLQPNNFARYFSDEVRRVQPGQVLQARPVNQAVSPVQQVARGVQGALDRVGIGAVKKEIPQAQSWGELDRALDQIGVLQGSGNHLYTPEKNKQLIMDLREGKIKFSNGADPSMAITSTGDLRAAVVRLLQARKIENAESWDELIEIVRQKGRVGDYSSEDMIRGLKAIRDGKTGKADPYEVVTRTDGLRDKAIELAGVPCPIFSLIPIAYAQGPAPCPKDPLAALARNAGNTARQVGDTVQNWFNAIFNVGKKQVLSWEVVVV